MHTQTNAHTDKDTVDRGSSAARQHRLQTSSVALAHREIVNAKGGRGHAQTHRQHRLHTAHLLSSYPVILSNIHRLKQNIYSLRFVLVVAG
jgi:hypothetical protein